MLKILFLVSLVLLAASHIQSVKSSSSGGSDAGVQKPCARFFHSETGEQLELPSLPEKKKLRRGAAAGSEGAFSFSSFTVMDGCLLSLWVAGSQEWGLESRSFPSRAYLNQLPGAGVSLTSYQCTCDQEENQVTANYKDFKNRHIADILFLVSLVLLAASHIQSVKSSSSGGSDAGVQKTCARLFHPETGEQLELPSLPEKKKQLLGGAAAGSEGAFSFSSFTVMDGCLLSLWVAGSQEWGLESRSFPSRAYLNQLPGAGVSLTSYQCTCDQEKNQVTANYKDFKNRHIAGENEKGSDEFCTWEINNRNINLNGECKYFNTFVFTEDINIINVCSNQGVWISRNLYTDVLKFVGTPPQKTKNAQFSLI
ncbi:hypothetical protein HHUSO_G35906 [Huso huso]|uniref:Ribonuclease A-domain domain-containing protein n=1 Tax=Huso huso TaxID=61971 RepID=A0ABR0Y284_HUSHU